MYEVVIGILSIAFSIGVVLVAIFVSKRFFRAQKEVREHVRGMISEAGWKIMSNTATDVTSVVPGLYDPLVQRSLTGKKQSLSHLRLQPETPVVAWRDHHGHKEWMVLQSYMTDDGEGQVFVSRVLVELPQSVQGEMYLHRPSGDFLLPEAMLHVERLSNTQVSLTTVPPELRLGTVAQALWKWRTNIHIPIEVYIHDQFATIMSTDVSFFGRKSATSAWLQAVDDCANILYTIKT